MNSVVMSSPRPLIGLTGRVARGADFVGLPDNFADVAIDMYVSAYATAIAAAGGLPVHLPQDIEVAAYAGHLDGVLLSGGTDVEPTRYGFDPGPELHAPEPARDAMELAVVELAIADELPMLGICRGLQLLNVHGGGTLHQHVPAHARFDADPAAETDLVTTVTGSRLHDLVGDRVAVNSLHHQTVDGVAPGWEIAGRGRDGTIEAIEWPGHEVIAVQWHPELLVTAATDPLFRWLVDAASRRRKLRTGGR
jgi:putative glutamine amidotransferase